MSDCKCDKIYNSPAIEKKMCELTDLVWAEAEKLVAADPTLHTSHIFGLSMYAIADAYLHALGIDVLPVVAVEVAQRAPSVEMHKVIKSKTAH